MKAKFLLIIMIACGLLLNSFRASAQTWDEWFHQDRTQTEYDARQISGLWLFFEKVSEGVVTVSKGLTTISNITNGDFNLGRDFFNSRKDVKPVIRDAAKVADIIAFQIYIVRDMNNVYEFCSQSKNFSADEVRYVERVHSNLLKLTDANISELLTIINPGNRDMTDDERLKRIDKIYEDMQDQKIFVKAFGDDARLIGSGRQKELSGVVGSRLNLF